MASSFGGTVKLTGESEYTKALKTITSNLTVMASEMKVVSSQFDKNDKSVQAITSRNNILNKEIQEGNKRISTYEEALKNFNKQQDKNATAMMDMMLNLEKENKKLEEFKSNTSSTSEQIKAQEKIVNSLSAELASAEAQYEKNKLTINRYQKELNLAQAEVNKFTNELKNNQSELEDANSSFKKLNASVDEQKEKLNQLRDKYASVVLEQGKNSKEARALKDEIKNLSTNIKESENRLSSATKEIDKFTQAEDDAGNHTITLSNIIKGNLISEGILAGIKGLANVMGTVAKGIVDLGKEAIQSYADYEQLIGGVETLFGDSANVISGYANNAYKTAGLSANQYMDTVTSFSASLLQSLDNDTEKSAEIANMAITDMSDNANKMGTSMESIQYAYQGFAKQNYTMLDNLKLGYGGTKEEMSRLISDASKLKDVQNELGVTVDANSMSFGNIVNAISVMQKQIGIAGTTSKEASITITGSINSMKASWQNLLVTFASGEGVEEATQKLFDNISTVVTNIAPVVMTILEQVPVFIEQLITIAVQEIPTVIDRLIPLLLKSAVNILNILIKGITDNLESIITAAISIILALIQGLSDTLPELIPIIVDAIILIVETLIDNLDLIINAGIELIGALILGIFNALPSLITKLPVLILKIREEMLKLIYVQIPKLGVQIVTSIIDGLFSYSSKLIQKIREFFKGTIFEPIVNKATDMASAGLNLVKGLWTGIKNAKDWLLNKIKGFSKSITQGIKDFFKIKSPSRLMADEVGQWLPKGIAVGIEANTDSALNSIDKMNDEIINKMNQAVNMEVAKASFSGTSGSVSQILSANSVIQVQNHNTLELDGEVVYENQQQVQQRKNLQYSFGGGTSK